MNEFTPVTIIKSNNVPDSTYFNTAEVEPIASGQTITILNGEGTRRGWGRPGVTSTVVFESLDLVAVHVGFHHKHGGGQFWRYYAINGEIRQVGWKDLDDDTRQAILDSKRPTWAKLPGKLRSQYKPANPKKNLFTAYKVCGLTGDGQLTSLYDPNLVYEVGKTKVQAARGYTSDWGDAIHDGGFYVHTNPIEVLEKYQSGNLVAEDKVQPTAALVKCECWGNAVQYDNGKIAVSFCRPVEVVQHIAM